MVCERLPPSAASRGVWPPPWQRGVCAWPPPFTGGCMGMARAGRQARVGKAIGQQVQQVPMQRSAARTCPSSPKLAHLLLGCRLRFIAAVAGCQRQAQAAEHARRRRCGRAALIATAVALLLLARRCAAAAFVVAGPAGLRRSPPLLLARQLALGGGCHLVLVGRLDGGALLRPLL